MAMKVKIQKDGSFTITGQCLEKPQKSKGKAGKMLLATGNIQGVKGDDVVGGQMNLWIK